MLALCGLVLSLHRSMMLACAKHRRRFVVQLVRVVAANLVGVQVAGIQTVAL